MFHIRQAKTRPRALGGLNFDVPMTRQMRIHIFAYSAQTGGLTENEAIIYYGTAPFLTCITLSFFHRQKTGGAEEEIQTKS